MYPLCNQIIWVYYLTTAIAEAGDKETPDMVKSREETPQQLTCKEWYFHCAVTGLTL